MSMYGHEKGVCGLESQNQREKDLNEGENKTAKW
jgi:hypothetical protein